MHRWSLPTSNGQTYLMLKATAVLSYPAQMAAAIETLLYLACFGGVAAPLTSLQVLFFFFFVVPGCGHAYPVIKTLYHSCPGETDAPPCAKEAPEGPPSSG